jgi:hypothetical protein
MNHMYCFEIKILVFFKNQIISDGIFDALL